MDILEHNRIAWNQHVKTGNEWTIPVPQQAIDTAVHGEYQIVLTPTKPIPKDWLGDVVHEHVLHNSNVMLTCLNSSSLASRLSRGTCRIYSIFLPTRLS